MLGQLDEQTKFSLKKVSGECIYFLSKEVRFVEKCHGILTGKTHKLDVKMFFYFILPFKDVQDFLSSCLLGKTFSKSLAVIYHERLQPFEELNLIKKGRE